MEPRKKWSPRPTGVGVRAAGASSSVDSVKVSELLSRVDGDTGKDLEDKTKNVGSAVEEIGSESDSESVTETESLKTEIKSTSDSKASEDETSSPTETTEDEDKSCEVKISVTEVESPEPEKEEEEPDFWATLKEDDAVDDKAVKVDENTTEPKDSYNWSQKLLSFTAYFSPSLIIEKIKTLRPAAATVETGNEPAPQETADEVPRIELIASEKLESEEPKPQVESPQLESEKQLIAEIEAKEVPKESMKIKIQQLLNSKLQIFSEWILAYFSIITNAVQQLTSDFDPLVARLTHVAWVIALFTILLSGLMWYEEPLSVTPDAPSVAPKAPSDIPEALLKAPSEALGEYDYTRFLAATDQQFEKAILDYNVLLVNVESKQQRRSNNYFSGQEGKEVRQRCQQSLSSHFFYAEPAFAEVFGAERLEGVNARYATMTTLLGRICEKLGEHEQEGFTGVLGTLNQNVWGFVYRQFYVPMLPRSLSPMLDELKDMVETSKTHTEDMEAANRSRVTKYVSFMYKVLSGLSLGELDLEVPAAMNQGLLDMLLEEVKDVPGEAPNADRYAGIQKAFTGLTDSTLPALWRELKEAALPPPETPAQFSLQVETLNTITRIVSQMKGVGGRWAWRPSDPQDWLLFFSQYAEVAQRAATALGENIKSYRSDLQEPSADQIAIPNDPIVSFQVKSSEGLDTVPYVKGTVEVKKPAAEEKKQAVVKEKQEHVKRQKILEDIKISKERAAEKHQKEKKIEIPLENKQKEKKIEIPLEKKPEEKKIEIPLEKKPKDKKIEIPLEKKPKEKKIEIPSKKVAVESVKTMKTDKKLPSKAHETVKTDSPEAKKITIHKPDVKKPEKAQKSLKTNKDTDKKKVKEQANDKVRKESAHKPTKNIEKQDISDKKVKNDKLKTAKVADVPKGKSKSKETSNLEKEKIKHSKEAASKKSGEKYEMKDTTKTFSSVKKSKDKIVPDKRSSDSKTKSDASSDDDDSEYIKSSKNKKYKKQYDRSKFKYPKHYDNDDKVKGRASEYHKKDQSSQKYDKSKKAKARKSMSCENRKDKRCEMKNKKASNDKKNIKEIRDKGSYQRRLKGKESYNEKSSSDKAQKGNTKRKAKAKDFKKAKSFDDDDDDDDEDDLENETKLYKHWKTKKSSNDKEGNKYRFVRRSESYNKNSDFSVKKKGKHWKRRESVR